MYGRSTSESVNSVDLHLSFYVPQPIQPMKLE